MIKKKYLYKFAPYPDNEKLIDLVTNAAFKVHERLRNVSYNDLNIGEDFKSYLGYKYESFETNLIKYSYQLICCLHNIKKELKNVVVVDHGGGTGLFSMLAKESGIGTVLYCDINQAWTNDAIKYAERVGIKADHYFVGDTDILADFINEKSFKVDLMCSYNVIEHVYSMSKLIKDVKKFYNDDMRIYMSTGANESNYYMRKEILPIHKQREYGDAEFESFLSIRRKMIQDINSSFKDDELDYLAKATRGMDKNDIADTVKKYMETKIKPPMPKHATNTCDPETGYWYENFMNPYELKDEFIANGIPVQLKPGYYGFPNKLSRRIISLIFNLYIRIFGNSALFIAPYWSIVKVSKD